MKLIGSHYFTSGNAVIVVQNDNASSYSTYIQIQDAIDRTVVTMRNEWSKKLFGINYDHLQQNEKTEAKKLEILKALVPHRVMERPPKNVAMY